MRYMLVAAGLAGLLAGAPVQAQTVTLKFAGWAPPNINVNIANQEWGKKVEEATGGEVKVEFYWETLANARTVYDVVRNGVADVGWVLQPLVPGKFPRSSVVELPFLVENATEGSAAIWKLYERGLIEEEYDEIKPMGIATLPPSILHSRVPLPDVASLAGKRFRIAGRVNAQIMGAVNATGVQMPITGVYEALSKGVIDASLSPWLGFTGFKHEEVTNYHVELPLGAIAGMMAMNRRTWESLSPKAREAIEKHSYAALATAYGQVSDRDVAANREKVKGMAGQTIATWPDAERKALEEKLHPIRNEWVKATPNGEAILKALEEELAAVR